MDPSDLLRCAARIDELTGVLRTRAARVSAALAASRWSSRAARLCAGRVDAAAWELERCAVAGAAAAAALRVEAARLMASP